MKLPIPIFKKDKTYHDVDIEKPDAGVLADTHDLLEKNNDEYQALHRMLWGSISRIGKTTDKAQIRSLCMKMPYASAEYVAINALLMTTDDDGVDGVYPCPVNNCGGQSMARIEKDEDGEEISNSLDYVSDFPVHIMGDGEEEISDHFHHDFPEPVQIKDVGGELIEEINSLTWLYPTLQTCMSARASTPAGDTAKMQLKIYAESIIEVNGAEPDITMSKWKNRYGYPAMKKLSIRDVNEALRKGRRWGYDSSKKKICPRCGNTWTVKVNPMGFFNSALREIA